MRLNWRNSWLVQPSHGQVDIAQGEDLIGLQRHRFEPRDLLTVDQGAIERIQILDIAKPCLDDLSANLAAASMFGIQTIKFVDADQCKKDLANLGCI